MSDWIDLQLSHSLGPVSAPDELWERIDFPAASAPRRRPAAVRWAIPAAVAACLVFLLARMAAYELRLSPVRYASADAAAVQRWLGHQAGVVVPLRPAAGVRIQGASVISPGIAQVAYQVDGHPATVLIARGSGPSLCKLPGYTITAAPSGAACKLCHSL